MLTTKPIDRRRAKIKDTREAEVVSSCPSVYALCHEQSLLAMFFGLLLSSFLFHNKFMRYSSHSARK
jgi:hypothetical protein